MHDLGIALDQLGRTQEGLPLIRQSRELARQAGDLNLFLRATNNFAATSVGSGDPWPDIMTVIEEGLALARRSVEHGFVSWLGGTMSELLTSLGRLDEALAVIEEALVASAAISDRDGTSARLHQRGWVRLLRGDPNGAIEDWARSRELVPESMPQAAMYVAFGEAVAVWDRDPDRALHIMVEAASTLESYGSAAEGAQWLARMALRAGDRRAFDAAHDLVDAGVSPAAGEGRALLRDWVHALAAEPTDLTALATTAERLEAAGYLGLAVDAWADAALVVARSARDSATYQERATALYAACHMVPVLGPLPETRWIAGVESSAGTVSVVAPGADDRL